jgi:hypothetical protein
MELLGRFESRIIQGSGPQQLSRTIRRKSGSSPFCHESPFLSRPCIIPWGLSILEPLRTAASHEPLRLPGGRLRRCPSRFDGMIMEYALNGGEGFADGVCYGKLT